MLYSNGSIKIELFSIKTNESPYLSIFSDLPAGLKLF